ncbi:unnamed protein product [Diamesa serratosioi]
MAKYFPVIVLLSVVVATIAQSGVGFYGGQPSFSIDKAAEIQSTNYKQMIDKINGSTLPEDLQKKAFQVVMNAVQNFDACEDLLRATQSLKDYKKCTEFEMWNVVLSISAIQRESSLRVTQPTPPVV